jgi:hypothetical protein
MNRAYEYQETMNHPNEPTPAPAATDVEMTVAVYAAPDQPTAEVVRGALESEGIPAVIGEQVAESLAGQLSIAEGYYAEVRVPPAYEAQARATLDAFDQGQNNVSDEELNAQAEAASDPGV